MTRGFLAGAVITIRIALPSDLAVNETPPLRVEWRDLSGGFVRSEELRVDGRTARLGPGPAASVFQLSGSGLISRPIRTTPADEVPTEVSLLRAALVRFPSADARTGRSSLFLVPEEATTVPLIRVDPPPGGGPVPVWPGRYRAALDPGDGPISSHLLELPSGGEQRLEPLWGSGTRPAKLRVTDRATGSRIESVEIEPGAAPEAAVFVAAVRTRMRQTEDPGVFDLGPLSPDSPSIHISSRGYRSAEVSFRGLAETPVLAVKLAPFQSIGVEWTEYARFKGRGALVECSRCEDFLGETCVSWRHHAEIALDRSGRGRLKAAPAGLYRLGVALPGAGRAGSSQLVETSSRSSDPDEVHVALSMREWTIRGRVVREDGEGQKAKVNGSTLVSERRRGVSDALFTAEADEAGWFVASFIAEEGVRFGLMATSEEPPARGRKAPLVAGPEVEASGIEVPLTATGVRVVLTDRQDGRPLANCAVRVSRTRDRRMLEGTTTDRDGQATSFVDFGEEAVRVGAECEGYVRPDEAVVELEEGELARTRLALDASRGLSVRVLGASGSPVGGASVFVLEHSISTNQPAYWLEPTLAGVTAEDGRLQLRGDRFGGRPMYVVGPGSGLFVGWLPSAIAARGSEAESIDVALSPPSTSPGVSVVTASGRFALPSWILFEKQGIPVPARILFDLARANGLILDSFFTDEESFLSRYLGPGEYAVSYLVHDRKLGALRAVPLGAMTLPAADRTEFRAMFIP